MQVNPLSEVLGVELVDFDITRPCDPQEQAELRRLLAQHHLIAVRGQELTEDDQSRFVGYFGPLHTLRSGGIAGYVTNKGGGIVGTGTDELLWHVDGGYGPHPGLATSLWAQESGDQSAPTSFANGVRALAQLPTDLRARIEPLSTLHMKDTWDLRGDHRWRMVDLPDAEPGRIVSQEHRIAYQLPYCDHQTLFVNQQQTSHVVGLPPEESEALLQELWSRMYADDNVYFHHWQTNDLVIWGNSALHHARRAMGTTPRHLRRQSLDGWYTDDGVLDWPESTVPAPAAVLSKAGM
jgi:taurine dioxygenase